MSEAIETAKKYISDEKYYEALKLARKRHGKDDVEDYLSILDMLIDRAYIIAIEEKGMYYQYYDETHDNGDYGEKYFDEYLKRQPRSINALCDKAYHDSTRETSMRQSNTWTRHMTNTNPIQILKSLA